MELTNAKTKQIAPGMFNGWTDGIKVIIMTSAVADRVTFSKQTHGAFDELWFVSTAEDVQLLIQTRSATSVCTFYVGCIPEEITQIRMSNPKADIFFLC